MVIHLEFYNGMLRSAKLNVFNRKLKLKHKKSTAHFQTVL